MGPPGWPSQPFPEATWMVTERWVALGTKHRTREVHAGRGHTPGWAREGRPPRGTCKRRRSLWIRGRRSPRALTKHKGQKKPLGSRHAQPGCPLCPRAARGGAVGRRRATCRRPLGHGHTNTDTRTHWAQAQHGPSFGGQVSPGGRGDRNTCPPRPPGETPAAAGEPGSAGQLLERLASHVLPRLLVTEPGRPWGVRPPESARSREPALPGARAFCVRAPSRNAPTWARAQPSHLGRAGRRCA